jgi:hypothetical protein
VDNWRRPAASCKTAYWFSVCQRSRRCLLITSLTSVCCCRVLSCACSVSSSACALPLLCYQRAWCTACLSAFYDLCISIDTRPDFCDIAVRPAGGDPIDGILFVFRNQLIKFFLSAGPLLGRLETGIQKLIKLLLVPYCLLLLVIAQLLARRG